MDKLMGVASDSEDERRHDLGSDEEFFGGMGDSDESDREMSDEEEEAPQPKAGKKGKKVFDAFAGSGSEDDNDDDEPVGKKSKSDKSQAVEKEQEGHAEEGHTEEQKNVNELYRKSKLKQHKEKKAKGKTGVVYLSKIPPYMKPIKMRQILSRFGEVDRLFLKRESTQKYQQRVKTGGNKKIMYEEGWAEFIRKKDAKLAADTLNGNTLGGKKGSFYYDDVMNVKYLSGFKWADLTEQISRENEIRQSKLQMEISQGRKIAKSFISGVQKSKMISNIQKKKGGEKEDSDIRRTFEQRKVTVSRADGPSEYKKEKKKSADTFANVL